MKKSFYIISIVAVLVSLQTAFAKVWTVSNNILSAGQFSSIQAAHDAALVGDTIYIAPSPTAYGNINMNKRLTLIGGGYYVTGTQFNYGTTIGDIYLDSKFNNTITGGVNIQGLQFSQIYRPNTSTILTNNVTIERCSNTSNIYVCGSNWILKNNFFDGNVYLYDNLNANFIASNVIVSNNIVTANISGYYYTTANPTVLITNNLFKYLGRITSMSYATISNNIFYFPYNQPGYPINTDVSNCTFNYNLTYSSIFAVATIPNASNTGGNNFNNQNPNIIGNLYGASNYTNAPLSAILGNNWRLSPSILGSDGKEIGLYGGFYPPANLGGVPAIPQMQILNINNAVVPQGGTLNVTFKARKQN